MIELFSVSPVYRIMRKRPTMYELSVENRPTTHVNDPLQTLPKKERKTTKGSGRKRWNGVTTPLCRWRKRLRLRYLMKILRYTHRHCTGTGSAGRYTRGVFIGIVCISCLASAGFKYPNDWIFMEKRTLSISTAPYCVHVYARSVPPHRPGRTGYCAGNIVQMSEERC